MENTIIEWVSSFKKVYFARKKANFVPLLNTRLEESIDSLFRRNEFRNFLLGVLKKFKKSKSGMSLEENFLILFSNVCESIINPDKRLTENDLIQEQMSSITELLRVLDVGFEIFLEITGEKSTNGGEEKRTSKKFIYMQYRKAADILLKQREATRALVDSFEWDELNKKFQAQTKKIKKSKEACA